MTGTGQSVPVPVADGDKRPPTDGAGPEGAEWDGEQLSLGVAAAARRLGVAPATLRTWDRRYGLGPSDHSPGRHRRYSTEDLARLDLMRRALLRGASAADAAQHARTGRLHLVEARPDPAPADPAPADPAPADPAPADAAPADAAPADAIPAVAAPARATDLEVPRRAGGGVLRLGSATPAARGLGRAAMALDSGAVRDQIRDAIDADGVVAAWDEVVRPVLVAVAQRWSYSGTGVEIEHLLSACAMAVFGVRAVPEPARSGAPPVLLAAMPGEQHVLPSVALAAALAERGVSCRPLGPDLPAAALVAAVRRTAPAAVFLWAQVARTADVEVLRALPRTRPRFRTYVGGPGWSGRELPPRVPVLTSLASACEEISGAVAV
ncbi:MerR family transcriptional regulator [Pseudonocardia sp. S2-4]|uniref:MerR family transcriptional regulator n=1 Tax=Pseudonocardia humida TaxID=2800819 RepID=A0ABT0ZVZ1_9PSEU|nr:MerR family transcriptional regulator [Pseudonocardia humida]